MLGNLRISSKLMLMVGLSVLGIVAVALVGLIALKSNLLEDRKNKLEELVSLAQQMIDLDYQASRKAGLSETEALERSKTILRLLHFDKDEYFYAFDLNGVGVAHPNRSLEGKSLMNVTDADGVYFVRQQIDIVTSGKSGFVSFRFPRPGIDQPLPKIAYVTGFKPYNWGIASGIYLDDVGNIFWSQARHMGALITAGLVLVVGMSLLVGRSIVNPIIGMTVVMHKLAKGDIETRIPGIDRGDEVGAMAQSVQTFKDALVETARLRREQDILKRQSEAEKKRLIVQLAEKFEQSVRISLDTLAKSASGMRAKSQSMSTIAGAASHQATAVAAAAEQATANVQAVAVATEELSSSVFEIGRQVAQSTVIAGNAVEEANRTNVTVQGLSAAAAKIGDVVGLINDIASQTNLLALNATIEAARAGDAGKGFAIVAHEVKSLASQTAMATEDISTHVATMQGATNEAVHAIESIVGTISSINEITTAIASAVEEQGAATQEIARNVQQAAQGTAEVSHNIVGVNQAANETGIAAGQVSESVEQLTRQSSALRANVDHFLASIRED
jgi:methyl-accepting chemotaxis protein